METTSPDRPRLLAWATALAIFTIAYNLGEGAIAITAASLIVMPILAWKKRQVATELDSRAGLADSAQTFACVYLSAVVLAGLILNSLLGWWWADPAAALGIVSLLLNEGREALFDDD